MKALGLKPRKTRRGHKDAFPLPHSSTEYQIELARRSIASIPEWLYNGKRIDGTEIRNRGNRPE